ncbi:MAG TPA: RnfABCDGE type electron transport complex subunit D [Candidatus Rifleibacterium sp.]|nr:RnfABCDGE type electron transport complex subunit D [Candidatus Rifleibacterium sp.]
MSTFLKQYVQYQKPQVNMLIALCLPLLGAVYNFGWRAAMFVFFSMFCCWLAEYLFTRREGKPASAAGPGYRRSAGPDLPAKCALLADRGW